MKSLKTSGNAEKTGSFPSSVEASPLELTGGSRLHFGLFSTSPGESPNIARVYGGLGLMIDSPRLCLRLRPTQDWQSESELRPRLREFRDKVRARFPQITPVHLEEKDTIPSHFGLGSGTQLGLAVIRLMTESVGLRLGIEDLCGISERGGRSAIGSHGFSLGGFIVDAGHKAGETDCLGQLASRFEFPHSWPIILTQLSDRPGLSGPREKAVFESLSKESLVIKVPDDQRRDRLCRLALLGVVPALLTCDWEGFTEGIGEFNRVAGEPFSIWQGGDHIKGADSWISFCRQNKVKGVGQSSWGPSLFAIAADEDQARFLANAWVQKGFGPEQKVQITRARNQGCLINQITPPS